jgi:hypothetical protein
MPKNIILCADGTGNIGGTTPDSNVYKVYKSIKKHLTQDDSLTDEQIVFYDNGVGTQKNKYWRMISGAFGFGFEDNVCDLYKFLARNYNPEDSVYFFGFSRGASTVRACNGFISACGLVKGKDLRNIELDSLVKEAFSAYKIYKKNPAKAEALKESNKSYGVIDIHFMGVWDTVVALGFPKRTEVKGPLSGFLELIFKSTENFLDRLWPHKFYNYKLTKNVKYAYQALAIDDERKSFWPFVWNEKGMGAETRVEQVWFAGMHSNVGGGYGRSGMASVPLLWMVIRATNAGLIFQDNILQNILEDSNIHSRMYNSRDGFAMFYRYHPREIETLCDDRLEGNIKIHSSVIERMNQRTANYAPGNLPGKFEVVETDIGAFVKLKNPSKNDQWARLSSKVNFWVSRRKRLYVLMVTFLSAVLFSVFQLKDTSIESIKRECFWGKMADSFDFFLPDLFDGVLNFAVYRHPYLFIGATIFVSVYFWVRRWCCKKTVSACEELRHLVILEDVDNGKS